MNERKSKKRKWLSAESGGRFKWPFQRKIAPKIIAVTVGPDILDSNAHQYGKRSTLFHGTEQK